FHVPHLELRAVESRTDLPVVLAAFPGGWAGVREHLRLHNVSAQILGTSFKLIGGSAGDWNELLTFARLAEALDVPWLRAFSGGTWGEPVTEADCAAAAASVRRWRDEKMRNHWRVDLLVETHDAFSASEPCRRLLGRLDDPVGILWDSHHTWRLGGEEPWETWNALGPHIRHVHLKDSIGVPSARHPFTYVRPGQGEMPVDCVLEVLAREGFSGAVSLEWEKMWHPYLPPLAEALAACRDKGWL
ncbi:MAG TPA: TIM barrel protein, partial [Terrimicrobiaceae bacterium]|nr:TIM barrel protein [Terrimicrobiaceae bacterium]